MIEVSQNRLPVDEGTFPGSEFDGRVPGFLRSWHVRPQGNWVSSGDSKRKRWDDLLLREGRASRHFVSLLRESPFGWERRICHFGKEDLVRSWKEIEE